MGFTRVADKGAWVWSKQKGIIWGYMFSQRRCLGVAKTEGQYMGLYVQLKKVPGCAQNRTLWS